MASIFEKNRLNIIIGAYGSGKSEVSVNCALLLKERMKDKKVLLADLDIVNPFYRSADAARKLNDSDIRVIFPSYANSNVDAPVLSGEIYVIFDDDSYVGVFDIGGEKNVALLFENVKGYNMPVLMNAFGSMERMAIAFGVGVDIEVTLYLTVHCIDG